MIRSFCIMCEVKKATEKYFPYCSAACRSASEHKGRR